MPSPPTPSTSQTQLLTLLTLLLSLTTPTLSFIPVQPLPSDLNTQIWIPIATITHTDISVSSPTPAHVLAERQGAVVTAAPAAQPAPLDPGQVSPITTYQVYEYKPNAAPVQVDVVYTQLFEGVPDQWPGPAAGRIGLRRRGVALNVQEPIGEPVPVDVDVNGHEDSTKMTKETNVVEDSEVQASSRVEFGDKNTPVAPALVEINGVSSRRGMTVTATALLAASLLLGAFIL